MQQLAQMQQQFQQQCNPANNAVVAQAYPVARRGRRGLEHRRKRKRHTWVKRPTTAYLYFVSKYRETLKEAGEVVPKVSNTILRSSLSFEKSHLCYARSIKLRSY